METPDDELFVARRKEHGLGPIVAHTIYLMNLATTDAEQLEKTIDAMVFCLRRAARLKIDYVVTHLGHRKVETEEERVLARTQVAASLTAASNLFLATPEAGISTPTILLENDSGHAGGTGGTPRAVAHIAKSYTGGLPIGICLDTCHIHAAGYDLSSEVGRETLLKEFDDEIGLSAIKVIHCNDSKGESGSHLDRHEHIGQGTIGSHGIGMLANHPYFSTIPWILETPGELSDDKRNLEAVRSLCKNQ